MFVGVDVGGTNIKIGLVGDSGKIIAADKFKTCQEKGPQDAMQRSAAAVEEMLRDNGFTMGDVAAAGLGTPGTMDIKAGMILEPPNLPDWRHFPVRQFLQDQVGIPVSYCNDANAAAMGEYWIGGGQEFNSLVLLTLGTGIGGGIIINDFLINGTHSLGGECGHVTIDWSPDARKCGCGVAGHLEAYASATAMVERYCEKFGNQEVARPTAKQIAEFAEQGQPQAVSVVEETADYLARGIAIFAHILDPEAILLGGAMDFGGPNSQLGSRFVDRISSQVCKQTFESIGKNLQIKFATLGGAAGWIGAAAIARQNYVRKTTGTHNLQ